jgi:hypothetical protein
MKVLITYDFLYKFIFSENKDKKNLEGILTELIKKNYKIYISAYTLSELYRSCDIEVLETLSVQFEILAEEILPFTNTVLKLFKKFEKSEVEFHVERATAVVYGLDKLLTEKGLVSLISFQTKRNHDRA